MVPVQAIIELYEKQVELYEQQVEVLQSSIASLKELSSNSSGVVVVGKIFVLIDS
jgi:hypothetical protein